MSNVTNSKSPVVPGKDEASNAKPNKVKGGKPKTSSKDNQRVNPDAKSQSVGGNKPPKGDKPKSTSKGGGKSMPVEGKGDPHKDKGTDPKSRTDGKGAAKDADVRSTNKASAFHPINVSNVELLCPPAPDILSKQDFGKMCRVDHGAGMYEGMPDIVRIAANTWLHLCRDTSQLLAMQVKEKMVQLGFAGAIKWCKGIYSSILTDGLASLHPSSYPWIADLQSEEDEARVLCCLCFCKRFTYGLTDTTSSLLKINSSLVGDIDYENPMHTYHRGKTFIPHTTIWREIKEVLKPVDDMFNGLTWSDIPLVYATPKGAAHNVCNCPLCKTIAMANMKKYGTSRPYVLPSDDWVSYDKNFSYIPYEKHMDKEGYLSYREPKKRVYPINVPKELGVSRVICPEDIDIYRDANSILQWVYTWLWDICPEIAFEDQSRAEINSYSGSVYHDTFTKDCSGASDRIPRSLVKYLLPHYYEFVKGTLSSHISTTDKDGKLVDHVMNMFATSGHPLTYFTESVIYWGGLKWSEKTYRLWALRELDSITEIVVIGDDTSGPQEISDIATTALEALFAVVNYSKSYDGDSPFRESCGYDYWKGHRVPPVHWPRKDMMKFKDLHSSAYNMYTEEWESPLSSTVSLLNDIEKWGFRSAANYLAYQLHLLGFAFAPFDADRTQNVAQHGRGGYRLFGSLSPEGKPYDLYVAKGPARVTDCMFATTVQITYHSRKPKRNCICQGVPAELLQFQYESILYDTFLEHGPRYATALDELLHVSEPNLPYSKAAGQPSFKLKLTPVARS